MHSKITSYFLLYYFTPGLVSIFTNFVAWLFPTRADLQFISPPYLGPPRCLYRPRRHMQQYHLRLRVLRRATSRPPTIAMRSSLDQPPTETPSSPSAQIPLEPLSSPSSSTPCSSAQQAPAACPSVHTASVQPPFTAPTFLPPGIPSHIIKEFCSTTDFLGLHHLSTWFSQTPDPRSFNHIQQEYRRLSHIFFNSSDPSPFPQTLNPSCIFLSAQENSVPVVVDSGASNGLTPFREDFVSFTPSSGSITGIGAQSEIRGFGTVCWKIVNQEGVIQVIESKAFYVPSAQIRLYSPQRDFIKHQSGSLTLSHDKCVLQLLKAKKALQFPFHPTSFLPLMIVVPEEQHGEGHRALVVEEDFSFTYQSPPSTFNTPTTADLQPPDIAPSAFTNAIMEEQNINLSRAQQELLGWHYKLGHVSMHTIQRFMHPLKHLDNSNIQDDQYSMPCLITTRNQRTHSCTPPKCAACILSKMERCPPSTKVSPGSNDRNSLKQNDLAPGDRISMDQYVVPQKGRTLSNSSRENEKYNGGTIYVNHASGYIFNHLQISLQTGETLVGKRLLEQQAAEHGHTLCSFQANNGVFTSEEFKQDLERKRQPIRFSGVGAHHQNGVAERNIKTISYLARAMLIHSALRWPGRHDLELWPFALDHAVYIWNHLPTADGFSAYEKWCGRKNPNNNHIRRLHPWGCPAYVLDPKLQDGQKLPKWNPRSRQGKFVGYSKLHASNVGLILNPTTKRISPQYHVMFDDFFSTVRSVDDTSDPVLEEVDWDRLIRLVGTDWYFAEEDIDHVPPVSVEWESREERRARVRNQERLSHQHEHLDPQREQQLGQQREHQLEQQREHQSGQQREHQSGQQRELSQPPLQRENCESSPCQQEESAVRSSSEIDPANIVSGPRARKPPRRYSQESFNFVRSQTPEPPFPAPVSEDIDPFESPVSVSALFSKARSLSQQYASSIESQELRFCTATEAQNKLNKKMTGNDILNQNIQNLDWSTSMAALASSSESTEAKQLFQLVEQYEDPIDGTLQESHPLILAAKLADQDTPRWREATTGNNADGFWEAMRTEITTLIKMGCWTIVDRTEDMHVVASTWAFKIKRYPSGLVRKLKARFCVRGDQQIEGIDVFETYAPVVSWTTIRMLLVLSVVLDLATVQVDYTAAFCQAALEHDVFIALPQGWQRLNTMGLPEAFGEGKVLKLKKSLYGQKDAPRNWFLHLKERLEKLGMKQSDHNPCLFIGNNVICLVYVDDCLFFSPDQTNIHSFIDKLRELDMDLNIEDNVAGFLGLQMKKLESGIISLTQVGLIDRILAALELEDSNPKLTPAPTECLGKDRNGTPFSQEFSYASIIGMLLYLTQTRPEISFAVSQCARYTHSPTMKHARYLKHIGRYLKHTCTKGLLLNPKRDSPLDIQCYVDADFAGLWCAEDEDDPHALKSRSGYVILLAGCPVIWKSKLQTLIAQSTMEAEYIALSTACKDLLPLQRLAKEVGDSLGVEKSQSTEIRSTIWEDNEACLKLANMELPYMTNRSKHIALKYHWFREYTAKGLWVVKPIASCDQLGDLFTKGLSAKVFVKLRRKIMGW